MKNFKDDIFVIGEYIDSAGKEQTLISLINKLKEIGIPIILSGHYPVRPEIQMMVDYYIFDKENPVVYGLDKKFFAENHAWRMEYALRAHDYAVWTTMRNTVNFANYLGKKNIHYMEYDCSPDIPQYISEFMNPLDYFDASVLSTSNLIEDYTTYIFSIKTNIGLSLFNSIKTKEEYFNNNDDFILEHMFYRKLHNITNMIYDSKYRSVGKDLNLYSVENWSIRRSFLVCDEYGILYYIFHIYDDIENFKIVVDYCGEKKEYKITEWYPFKTVTRAGVFDEYKAYVLKIGEYKANETIKVYYEDNEVSSTELNKTMEEYRKLCNINFKNK